MRILLWLQLPVLVVLGVIETRDPIHNGHAGSGASVVSVMVAFVLLCCVTSALSLSRRVDAGVVSVGLLMGAAAIVHIGNGMTDLHFSFFVVLGLISLYQDGKILVMSVVLVLTHHLVVGSVAPKMLYSDQAAWLFPVRFALLHSVFVLAMCTVQVAYWHFAQHAEQEKHQIQAAAQEEVRRSAERFEALVHDSSDVISVIDGHGRIASVAGDVRGVTGHRPDDLIGTPYRQWIHPDDRQTLVTTGYGDRIEVRALHADGEWHWHEVSQRDLSNHPAVGGLVVNHRDVTERRQLQDKLRFEATHDPLTGLANRAELMRHLRQALALSTPTSGVAVVYLDLNGFKQINDTFGHEAGDELLVTVAAALHRSIRGGDCASRLGGDEFVAVASGISGPEDADAVARRIQAEINHPVLINGTPVVPRTSIGMALAGPGRHDAERLLHHADVAMYHAKREHNTGWQTYVEGMHDPSTPDANLEDELRDAVAADELRLMFQPIVDLATGEMTALEALVRWQHPTRGMLSPAEFLPLADQSPQAHHIGLWVIRRACEQMSHWRRTLPAGPHLSLHINLSARQLQHPDLVRGMADVLNDTGHPPADLVLEVSETALDNDPTGTDRLAMLRTLGVRIALDDFGAQRASLPHLARLPIDIVKIDRNFIAELDGTPQGSAVTEAIINLGRARHLQTIAVGVESTAQLTEITLLGCDAAQGYVYANPLSDRHVTELLRRSHHGRRMVPAAAERP